MYRLQYPALKALVLFLALFTCALLPAQDAEFYYKQGLEQAQKGDLEKALGLFDKSISLKQDEYVAWYNRAIVKSMMHRYEDALADLEQTIKLNPGYKKAYLNRGTARKHLTDYQGALEDYSLAMQLDSAYAEAYYNRGLVYELFEKKNLACADFTKAYELGYKAAERKTQRCTDTVKSTVEIHPVLRLRNVAADYQYGFTQEKPIKVGTGPDGGPANERAYFDLLRDMSGNPVSYTRVSSCCAYPSKNAPLGLAMLDKYELRFHDKDGTEKTVNVYVSFYDYEEPEVLPGFNTVKPN
jgi:tetratricopeptide (TPR) repeat protein